jgi:hypothetical protein
MFFYFLIIGCPSERSLRDVACPTQVVSRSHGFVRSQDVAIATLRSLLLRRSGSEAEASTLRRNDREGFAGLIRECVSVPAG